MHIMGWVIALALIGVLQHQEQIYGHIQSLDVAVRNQSVRRGFFPSLVQKRMLAQLMSLAALWIMGLAAKLQTPPA